MKKDLSKYFLPNLNLARKRLNESVIKDNLFLIPENLLNHKLYLKFHIKTYGCQSNVRDTETMHGILETIGFTHAPNIEDADLVILNTCAIREHAEDKVFAEIGKLEKIKKINPNFIFGMAGCMSQEEAVVNRILQNNSSIDFIFGTHNIFRLPQILEEVIFEKNSIIEVWSKEGDVIENLPSYRNNNFKAFVNIMYGCDKFCTYCIVPFTRGKIRSRQSLDILSEVKELISNGFKEVTLIGQNVNAYGIDFKDEKYSFANLLEDVAKTKIERIRFTTSNPWNFTDDIIEVMSKYSNIMPHIHLPIQSGNEDILKKMNRMMKIDDYIKKIKLIRSRIKNCSITTDLIVGFPNETEEQFLDTINLYKQIKFDNAYTFIFSKRSGTVAAKIDDQIDNETKKKRLIELNEIVKIYSKENNLKFNNTTLPILVEGYSKTNKEKLFGYSPQWKVVNFNGNAKPGDIVNVKITSCSRFSLNGEQVN